MAGYQYQGNYIGLEEMSPASPQSLMGRYYTDISSPPDSLQSPVGRYYRVVDYYHEDLSSSSSSSASSNGTTEIFPSALKQLRKPSQAAITDDFIKKYYWNERFQLLLEKPVTNKEEGNRRHTEIAEHSQSLADNAMPFVKTIVDEVDLPFERKTHKPIDAGGLAGGQKYIVDKMFVKFASDVYSLYGGDDNAAKAAGHELKGLSALISCNIPNLHFPLLCVINYKGYRVTVISRIPVDKSTIIYGSDDAGNTVHNRSYEIDKMLRHAAEILNLKVHKVKEHSTGDIKEVPVPIDLEGHQGTDGRYYVVDFARLLPPETPFPPGTAAYLFRMLRPEFVRQYPRALSSDAFSPFGADDAADSNQQAKEATKFLHLKAIPQLAESLPSLLENPKNGDKHIDENDVAPLKKILHKYGINLRYLALLLHHVIKYHTAQHRTSQVVALEMVARSMKSILNGKMRLSNSVNAIPICVESLNLVLSTTPNDFWDASLRPQITRQFVCHLNECSAGAIDTIKRLVEQDYLVLIVKDFRLPLLRRVSGLAGIILNAEKVKDLQNQPPEFWDAAQPLDMDCIEDISMTTKHISVVPIAEVLRMEGRFLEAERFYQDEMNLRIKVLGADSLQVAVTMTHLAALYAEMASKDHLAENYFNQAIHIYEIRRPESLELALAYERLAMFCFRRDKYKEAEEILEKVYEIKQKLLGVHNEVATTVEHQAWVAHAQQKYELAVKLFTEAVEIKKTTLSEDSLEVAKTLNNLGQTLVVLKKPEQARQLYEKVLEILIHQRGTMHSDVAVALDNLAKLCASDTKTLGKAELYFNQALTIKKEALGEDHAFTAITQDHLAQLLTRCSRYEEAEDLYKKAIATLRKKLGTRHSSVAITLHNIAQLYARRRNWNRAMEAEEEAARIFADVLGEDNELTLAAEAALKEIQKRSGVISRLLSKSMDLPTMPHVGRIITDNADTTPIRPRKPKALDDENKLPEEYRRLLRSAGIKQGESDPALLAAVLAIVKEVTAAPPSTATPAPLSVPSSPPMRERKPLSRTPHASNLSFSGDVPGPHANKKAKPPKKERAENPRSIFAGLRLGGKGSVSDPVISEPYDFQHISHVGFSKDGMEMYNIPSTWKSVFSLNLSLPSVSAPTSPSPREPPSPTSFSAPTSPTSSTSPSHFPFLRSGSADATRRSFLFSGAKKKKDSGKERDKEREKKKERAESMSPREQLSMADDQIEELEQQKSPRAQEMHEREQDETERAQPSPESGGAPKVHAAAKSKRYPVYQSLPEFPTTTRKNSHALPASSTSPSRLEHTTAPLSPRSPDQPKEQALHKPNRASFPLRKSTESPRGEAEAMRTAEESPRGGGGGRVSPRAKYASVASKSFTTSPTSSLGASLDMRMTGQRQAPKPASARPAHASAPPLKGPARPVAPLPPAAPAAPPAPGGPPPPPPPSAQSQPPPPPPARAPSPPTTSREDAAPVHENLSPRPPTATVRAKSISTETSFSRPIPPLERARKITNAPSIPQIESAPNLLSAFPYGERDQISEPLPPSHVHVVPPPSPTAASSLSPSPISPMSNAAPRSLSPSFQAPSFPLSLAAPITPLPTLPFSTAAPQGGIGRGAALQVQNGSRPSSFSDFDFAEFPRTTSASQSQSNFPTPTLASTLATPASALPTPVPAAAPGYGFSAPGAAFQFESDDSELTSEPVPDFVEPPHTAMRFPRSATADLSHISTSPPLSRSPQKSPVLTGKAAATSDKSPAPKEPSFLSALSSAVHTDDATASFINSLSRTPPSSAPLPLPVLRNSHSSSRLSISPRKSDLADKPGAVVLTEEKQKQKQKQRQEEQKKEQKRKEHDDEEDEEGDEGGYHAHEDASDYAEPHGHAEDSSEDSDEEDEEYDAHDEFLAEITAPPEADAEALPDSDEALPDLSHLTPTQWHNLVALVRDTSYRHRIIAAFADS